MEIFVRVLKCAWGVFAKLFKQKANIRAESKKKKDIVVNHDYEQASKLFETKYRAEIGAVRVHRATLVRIAQRKTQAAIRIQAWWRGVKDRAMVEKIKYRALKREWRQLTRLRKPGPVGKWFATEAEFEADLSLTPQQRSQLIKINKDRLIATTFKPIRANLLANILGKLVRARFVRLKEQRRIKLIVEHWAGVEDPTLTRKLLWGEVGADRSPHKKAVSYLFWRHQSLTRKPVELELARKFRWENSFPISEHPSFHNWFPKALAYFKSASAVSDWEMSHEAVSRALRNHKYPGSFIHHKGIIMARSWACINSIRDSKPEAKLVDSLAQNVGPILISWTSPLEEIDLTDKHTICLDSKVPLFEGIVYNIVPTVEIDDGLIEERWELQPLNKSQEFDSYPKIVVGAALTARLNRKVQPARPQVPATTTVRPRPVVAIRGRTNFRPGFARSHPGVPTSDVKEDEWAGKTTDGY